MATSNFTDNALAPYAAKGQSKVLCSLYRARILPVASGG